MIFSVAGTDKLIVNDMALLLHLATSSNNKLLPFFTVFLMDEWKEKFSACNESISKLLITVVCNLFNVELAIIN